MPPKRRNHKENSGEPESASAMEARLESLENVMKGFMMEMRGQLNAVTARQAQFQEWVEKSSGGNSNADAENSTGGIPKQGDEGNGSETQNLGNEEMEEFRRSVKKIKLPMFNGEDPVSWITRAEIYFQVQGTRPAVKVSLAQVCMEGGTIHFFNMLLKDYGTLTWEDLKKELVERYGGVGEGSVFEQLTSLKQGGSIDEYICEFECLVAQVPKLFDDQFFAISFMG